MSTPDLPVGRRIAHLRRQRGITQQMLADQLGRSKSWLEKVENGRRRVDKVSILHQLADLLDVHPNQLTTPDRPAAAQHQAVVDLAQIHAVLDRYPSLHTWFGGDPPPGPDPATLRQRVDHLWHTLQRARLGTVLNTLPDLLLDAQHADAATDFDHPHAAVAARLLAEVYQIASTTLRTVGEHHLAWLTADRSTNITQHAGDEPLTGLATVRTGLALADMGSAHTAVETALAVAHAAAPPASAGGDPTRMSVYGSLLCAAAYAAAHAGDSPTVRDLLAEAETVADRVGEDSNVLWTGFGPALVASHRIRCAVELREPARAVRMLDHAPPGLLPRLMPDRRVHHLVTAARARTAVGDGAAAARLLLDADRQAPGELRMWPTARAAAAELCRRYRDVPATVGELATAGG